MATDVADRARSTRVRTILGWYDEHGRDLPWRRPEATPWSKVISEFMLQQTPVSRVLDPWSTWVERWPSPAALAAAPPGEAIRAWGRLGYPRRALRLHQAATVITVQHGGQVPADYAALRQLPGVGDYTAAAIASFAFGRRHVVLDTNVRRVLARLEGADLAPHAPVSVAERARAERYLPRAGHRAARWAVASMELGALVCTARAPRCDACPVASRCAWRRSGTSASRTAYRRQPAYEGTDRQCRGSLLGVLRSTDGPVDAAELAATWPLDEQRSRCLESLRADGLLAVVGPNRYALPSALSDVQED